MSCRMFGNLRCAVTPPALNVLSASASVLTSVCGDGHPIPGRRRSQRPECHRCLRHRNSQGHRDSWWVCVFVCVCVCVCVCVFPLSLPRFTPEGVASVAQWGLLALIGYWLLTVILRLFIGLLRQVFWILKTVAALWLFGLIVSDAHAGTDTTAIRLAGLVLGCALLGVAFPSSEKTVGVEGRLGQLEGRVRALEGRKGED
uniref:Si:dkey-74k8.3 n=1 Tax=Gadus morhua TaxID=8049 RepID=A0A8C4ZIP3_GADMO